MKSVKGLHFMEITANIEFSHFSLLRTAYKLHAVWLMVVSRWSRVRVEIKVRKLQLSKNQVSLKRVTGEKKLFDADNPYQMYVAWIVIYDSGYLILIRQYFIYFFC